jgi:hypothetical protein
MNNIDIDLEQHCNLPRTALTLTMNNIDICHEQHCHLPWTLVFVVNNIVIYHEHWYLPWTTLLFTMNIGICHERHWHVTLTIVTFAMNIIDICHEHTDVYNTWSENLIFKTTNKFYCKIPLSNFVSINRKLRSLLFWDVMQRRSEVTDVSVHRKR